jgi:bifunctional DNase/RNase
MPLAEVDFFDLRYDHRHKSPVLFLKDAQREKYLPVWIGELEANSIELAVVQRGVPRPLTHDLLLSVMHDLGGNLQRVVIDRLEQRTYYATLVLEHDGRLIHIDCRPSDAIALALREKVAIFVDDELMYSIKFVEISEGEDSEGDDDEPVDYDSFADFLKSISPSDFKDS